MAKDEAKRPAQVPGDAESPGNGETDRAIKDGLRRTDKTEPTQSEREGTGHSSR